MAKSFPIPKDIHDLVTEFNHSKRANDPRHSAKMTGFVKEHSTNPDNEEDITNRMSYYLDALKQQDTDEKNKLTKSQDQIVNQPKSWLDEMMEDLKGGGAQKAPSPQEWQSDLEASKLKSGTGDKNDDEFKAQLYSGQKQILDNTNKSLQDKIWDFFR